jgi:hypothetical protein
LWESPRQLPDVSSAIRKLPGKGLGGDQRDLLDEDFWTVSRRFFPDTHRLVCQLIRAYTSFPLMAKPLHFLSIHRWHYRIQEDPPTMPTADGAHKNHSDLVRRCRVGEECLFGFAFRPRSRPPRLLPRLPCLLLRHAHECVRSRRFGRRRQYPAVAVENRRLLRNPRQALALPEEKMKSIRSFAQFLRDGAA